MEESLEHIRESAETRMRKNAFMLHNYIELERVEKDLADNATGAAAHSDGRYYVTQTSALHFLRNQATGTVRASAWVRHRGKSTVLTAVDITGEGGRLLATGEFTFFCVDKALMDQKAAAEQK